MSQRGFTVIELALAAAFLAMIFGSAAMAVATDMKTARVLVGHMGPELRAQGVLERIASEIRMAGEYGEDLDHDGQMDDGEDSNGNGVFDSDWDLADGAVDQASVTFNRRIDDVAEDGSVLSSGIYSRRVRYMMGGDSLVREWSYTMEDGSTSVRRSVLAAKVGGLRFSRTGKLVTISLDVLLPEGIYKTDRRTVTTQVWLRN